MLDYGAVLHGAAGKVLFPRFSAMDEGPQMRELFIESTSALLGFRWSYLFRSWCHAGFTAAVDGRRVRSEIWDSCPVACGSYALQGAFVPTSLAQRTARVHWLSTVLIAFGTIGIA